jgi:hypothetical protein
MKHLQEYEFYKGSYKAAGFKHYQETPFVLMIQTTEEGKDELIENSKNFIIHLKRLGIEFNGVANEEGVSFVFYAVNKYEALSIVDNISTYFRNKKIPILRADIIEDPNKDEELEKQLQRAKDITVFAKRREIPEFLKMQMSEEELKAVKDKMSFMQNQAYKQSRIGF